MKKALIIAALFICSLKIAQASDYGTCTADPDSKRYLSNTFSDPYPKIVKFKCLYTCKLESSEVSIWGTLEKNITSQSDDAKNTVCQGVKVKRVSWGWDFAGVDSFYIFSSQSPELKEYAKENISRENKHELALITSLKETAEVVTNSYAMVSRPGFLYFGQAATEIKEIVSGLPGDTTKLDEVISKIKKAQKEPSHESSEYLVFNFFRSSAAFRF